MKSSRSNALKIACIVGVFVMVVLFLVFRNAQPSLPPLPDPNGYDDFVAAGKLLVKGATDFEEMDANQLRTLVVSNAPALKRARLGMQHDCQVPANYSIEFVTGSAMQEWMDYLGRTKALSRAFVAEGRLAELEGRNWQAVQSYLESALFGRKATKGGTMLDGLVGVACEAQGFPSIEPLIQELEADRCREALRSLERVRDTTDSLEAVLDQENRFIRKTSSLGQKIRSFLDRRSNVATEAVFTQKYFAQERLRNQLMLTLAARAYELENDHPPATATELVPDYLNELPKDPATGDPLSLPPQ